MNEIVCQISGDLFYGVGKTLKNHRLVICTNGHIFKETYLTDIIGDLDEWRYCIPHANCPICTLHHIDVNLINRYNMKQGNTKKSVDLIKREIFYKFRNLETLKKYLDS